MKRIRLYFILGVLLLGLILIRAFQNSLFYDPFINYFKGNYLNNPFPDVKIGYFLIHILFRYFLNTIFSLAIIQMLFKNSKTLFFSIKFYLLVFFIFTPILVVLIEFYEFKMLLFYIRRFLIQPLFLFILIPAFYYQKLKRNNH